MLRELLDLDGRVTAVLRIAEQPGWLRSFAAFFAHSGDSWFCYLGLGLIWLLGDAVWKERAIIFGICIFITAMVVLTIKFSVRRRRPEGEWGNIYRKTDPHSFPSGHAARAVLMAVLAFVLGPVWFGWGMALWAPLVILARVAMGVHYVSDVLAGALLGVLLGWVFALFIPTLTFLV